MKKPTPQMISKRLRELRRVVEGDPDPIVRRLAYTVETVLRWSTEDTVKWPTPVEEVYANARLLKAELADQRTTVSG